LGTHAIDGLLGVTGSQRATLHQRQERDPGRRFYPRKPEVPPESSVGIGTLSVRE